MHARPSITIIMPCAASASLYYYLSSLLLYVLFLRADLIEKRSVYNTDTPLFYLYANQCAMLR